MDLSYIDSELLNFLGDEDDDSIDNDGPTSNTEQQMYLPNGGPSSRGHPQAQSVQAGPNQGETSQIPYPDSLQSVVRNNSGHEGSSSGTSTSVALPLHHQQGLSYFPHFTALPYPMTNGVTSQNVNEIRCMPGIQAVPSLNAVTAPSNKPTQSTATLKTDPASATTTQQPPPFRLFSAPCELRHNYLQATQAHNLPPLTDSNSYHYGMAINGFHPQNAYPNPPVLIDNRHRTPKAGKERNEREQRRAQRITELIESLRINMVQGGWKVEMKSKFHTLSTCAEYVKHLIKLTSEKEKAVERAKSILEIRRRKIKEDGDGSETVLPNHDMGDDRKRKATEQEEPVKSPKRMKSPSSEIHCIADNTELKPNSSQKSEDANSTSRKQEKEQVSNTTEVDYEKVFMTSNVPQLISTPAGRIIRWNDVFLKITGLTAKQVKPLTLFSMVKNDKLSNMFEIVGTALKEGSYATAFSSGMGSVPSQLDSVDIASQGLITKQGDDGSTHISSLEQPWSYAEKTLPCIQFKNNEVDANQLYMTVTLMNKFDPERKFLHTVFSDCPGMNGAMGSISGTTATALFT